jgi:peptidyl-prolyl cis-trans isomerase D
MLSTMRKTANGFFVKILIGVLILSFAVWGIGDIFRSTADNSVATVGSEKITAQQYYSRLNTLRANMGEFFSVDMLKSLNIYQMVLGDMVSNALIRQEAEKRDLRIGDALLKKALRADDNFHNDKGNFDRVIFEQYLKQTRQSEREFLDNFKNAIAHELLQQTVTPDAIVSPELVKVMHTIEREEREVLTLLIDYVDENTLPTVDEAALRVFYEANKSQYIAPEYRSIHYVVLDEKSVKEDIDITENELRDLFFENEKTLTTPEKRDVTQLLYKNKATAESAYSLFRSTQSLDAVIKAFPPENKDVMSLGIVSKVQLPVAAEVIFSSKKGDVTAPTESDFGWHIFYVNDIIMPKAPSFESTKAQLEKDLRAIRSEESYAEALEKFEDTTASGANLEEIAKTMGLLVQKTPAITKTGQAADNTQALDADAEAVLLEQAFSLQKGITSDVIQRSDGSHMVVKVIEVTPSRERAFDEVKGIVTEDWKTKERFQAKQRYAQMVTDAIKGSATIEEATQRLKNFTIAHTEVARFTRKGLADTSEKLDIMKLPQGFAQEIFNAEKPMHGLSATAYGDDMVITGLYIQTLEANQNSDAEGLKDLQATLQNTYEQEIGQQYLSALRTIYPVKQHNDVLTQIIEQF